MSEKKILISGATAGTNFGDFLFAKMFQEFIGSKIGLKNTYFYDSKYALSDFFKHHLGYDRKYKLGEINALVYMSGGYFCGDDRTLRDYILRYLRYFHIGLKCIAKRIPIGIFAVEVGPTKNRIIRLVEKTILRKAAPLIVRNKESLEYCNSIISSKAMSSHMGG